MSDFTIQSTNAPLVEVAGNGPYADLAGGLAVPDGVPTTGEVDLLNGFIRSWRVDAPSSVQTTVDVPSSPYGVFVQRRSCVRRSVIWRALSKLWLPLARRFDAVRKHDVVGYLLSPCAWLDVGDGSGPQVVANGGDVVAVSFVVP